MSSNEDSVLNCCSNIIDHGGRFMIEDKTQRQAELQWPLLMMHPPDQDYLTNRFHLGQRRERKVQASSKLR
ncbi:hypothetical protein AFLA_011425 [Aspergillus flavus NRRL3357]|nr:hypothetical protein AFLA_011425 [Aspergillus flavus NRRL3357]